jgi:hypothetical protein
MAEPETDALEDVALLWVRTGWDAYGNPTLSDRPTEVKVKWNDTLFADADKQANRIGHDAEVVVDRHIPLGSLMWLGRLNEWPDFQASPSLWPSDRQVMEVRRWKKVKDIKGRTAYAEVSLSRYRGTLPASGIQGIRGSQNMP